MCDDATHRCQKLRRRHRFRHVSRKVDSTSEIEITNLNRTDGVSVDAQDVLWLEVTVGNAFLVKEVEARGDLLHDLGGIVFREADVLLNPCQQRSAVDLLEHQVELLLVLEELDELQDVGMTLAMVEGFDLAEDTRASMSWYLVDDLHGALGVGEDVDTRLY